MVIDMLKQHKPFYNFGPGDFIKEEIDVRGWQQIDLADILGMSKKSVNKLIKNKQSITIETAKLLSKAFGQSPQYWINLDTNYRLRLSDDTTHENNIEIKAKIYNYMPIKEMIERAWIRKTETTQELVAEVKNFWNIKEINFDFLDNQILPNFRKSDAYGKFNQYYALTWFQMAKNCSKKYHVDTFNKNILKQLSLKISGFSNKENGVELFINELSKAGVKFFVLNHLQKTYTDGASFFDESNPVIVYTDRYHRIDNFWFTVAHEISHILLHLKNKGDFIIDEHNKLDTDKEKEADRYAANILKEKEILAFFNRSGKRTTKAVVITCSTLININEAIIVGILQHHEKLPWTHLRGFTSKTSNYIPSKYLVENNLEI